MEEYPHNKGNKKVNFVYFPSLISNWCYLDKGKQWVFTYINNEKNKTFFIENIKLEPLIDRSKKFYIPKLKDKLKIGLKIEPEINYKISQRAKKEYVFHLKDKNTNEIKEIKNDSFIKIENNEELVKLDFYLMSEYICSFPW